MSEARITKLEDFAIETRDRLARIETRLDHVATKSDLAVLRGEMLEGFSALRGEMLEGFSTLRGEMLEGFSTLRGEMRSESSAIRGELTGGLSGLRADMHAQFAVQTRWMIANSLATVGMVVAALKFLR